MNLFGDAVHNFIDGLVIAASYSVSIHLGIATTIAVILHEIPQEIGDFGVLIHGGLSVKKALFFNFLSALTSIIGAVLFFLVGDFLGNFRMALIPVTAGGFIYIVGIVFVSVILSGCASLSYRLAAGDDENARLSALEEIKYLDDKGKAQTANDLKEYLNNSNSSVRSRAAEALLKLGPEAGIPVFISILADKNQEIRIMAEEYVAKFGSKALLPLLKTLDSPDKFQRAHAAYALGEIRPSLLEVTRRLFISMGEDDKYVSGAARDAIIKTGIIDIEDLLKALKSENGSSCFGAAFIAGKKKIADKRVLEALLNNLKFSNIVVKNGAENALVEIGTASREAVEIMLEKYRTDDDFMKECVTVIFGNIGIPASETIVELSNALKGNNNRLVIAAAESLCKINSSSEGILKNIITLAASSDLERKITALNCLGKMRVNYKDISECLINAFGDNIVLVRDAAVKSYIKVAYLSKDSGDAIGGFNSSIPN